jgi:integrase
MARQYLMSWIPKQKRWMKLYKGHRYAVSCRQLDVPTTKEDSWRAANDWWRKKLAELEVAAHASHPHREHLDLLAAQREWALRHGQTDLANALSAHIEETEKLTEDVIMQQPDGIEPPHGDGPVVADNIRIAELFGVTVPPDLDPQIARYLFGDHRIWQERFSRDRHPRTPAEKTVGRQVDRWVEIQQASAHAGKITPDRADNNRIALNHFKTFMNAGSPVEAITAERLDDYFMFCLGKVAERQKDSAKRAGWSVDYAKKVFGVARTFIRFLWERGGVVELPRNISSPAFKFKVASRRVPTMTDEELKMQVGNATGQLKLHLLLMANCGMLQTDISELRQSEVDWAAGRIIRKRSKTKDAEDVPTVNYKLWPITFQLLQRYRSADPEFVLLTESGNRWVGKAMLVSGKLKKADNIASCYVHLKKKTGIRKALKLIRKTSASKIEGHKEYGRYKTHFLGHSPRTVADRHYAAPSVELFDEIIGWLGRQYGFVSDPAAAATGQATTV